MPHGTEGTSTKAKGGDAALSKLRHAPFYRQPRPVCGRVEIRQPNSETGWWGPVAMVRSARGSTGAARDHLLNLIPRADTRHRYGGDERPLGVRPGLLLPGRVLARIPVSSFRGAQRRGIQAAVIVRFSKASGDERPLVSPVSPPPEPLHRVHNGGNPAKAKGDGAALSKPRHAPFFPTRFAGGG